MTEPAPAAVDQILEELTAEHTADPHAVVDARQAYEERRGRVFQDEPLWEAWSAAFIEWFLVERVAPGADGPVARTTWLRARAAVAAGDATAIGREALLRAYLTSHRSLFEIRALDDGRVELADLIGGAQFAVAEPRTMHGVDVGDVAELRLIGAGGDVQFGRTFVYHPLAARAAIAAHVKALVARGDDRRAIIDHVASLRLKVNRYRHVAPSKVYEFGGRHLPE